MLPDESQTPENTTTHATVGAASREPLPRAAAENAAALSAEDALALALARASAAGRWDLVATLAEELRARRLAADVVADLAARRRRDAR